MLTVRTPDRALLTVVLVALAVTASAQSLPAGHRVADSQPGQLWPPLVTTGGRGPADRASGEAASERLRQRPNGGASLLGDIARDYRAFFTTPSTYQLLGVGLGASLALRPLDTPIAMSRFNAELWENSRLDRTFESGELLGGALVQMGGAFATYGVGKMTGKPGLAELGRDLVRAQMLVQGVTQVIKYSGGSVALDPMGRATHPSRLAMRREVSRPLPCSSVTTGGKRASPRTPSPRTSRPLA